MFWEARMGFEDMTIWATPPRGVTKSTVRIGPDIRHHYTYFCDANNDCFAVAYATTEEAARRELTDHVCPAPVRRDMMPSGKTAVQKMWDELDEAYDQLMAFEGVPILPGQPDIATGARNYARGLAMALAFVSIPYFRSQEDILREAHKRWRIRQGELTWEATPGYNFYPAAPLAYAEKAAPVTRKPLKAAKAAPAPAPVKQRDFTVAERTMIQESVHGGTVSVSDLAGMFGVSENRIMTIAGPKPVEGDDDLFAMVELF